MHLCICYHRSTHRLDGLHICLALVSAALLGFSRQGGFSPFRFTPAFRRGWYMPISRFFWFYKVCRPTPWPLEKYWCVRSVLEDTTSTFVCLTFFGVGSKDVSNLSCALYAIFPWGYVPILSLFLYLVSGSSSSFNRAVTAVVSRDFRFLFSCVEGAPKFLEGLFRSCEWCPVISSTCLIFSLFCNIEGLDELYSLLSDRISLVAVFSLNYVAEERIKYR